MKRISLFLVYILSFLYLEFLFKILLKISIFNLGLLPMIFFILCTSSLLLVITKIFPEKGNKWVFFIIMLAFGIWFAAQYVVKQSTEFYFDWGFATNAGGNIMEGEFKKATYSTIIRHIPQILLFFIPLILVLIFNKKVNFKKAKPAKLLILIIFITIWILCYKGVLLIKKNDDFSAYELVYVTRENNLNIEKLGVLNSFYLDTKRSIFGFEESLSLVDAPKKTTPVEKTYDYNVLDIDFEKLYEESKDSTVKQMTQYFMNDTGTLQNDYTGLFKGKNLIYIMAESFNGMAVSEELTPTLYKMIHSGFEFTNFYNPTIASTIGGETQLLTGLYPAAYGPMQHNPSEFTMGLGHMFTEIGYNNYAYHDWTYSFQGRNNYLARMGFTNYKGCGNGLQKIMNCTWLPSDIDMVEATVPEYVNSEEPFVVFYATVSGHGGWSFSTNKISQKYKTEVQAKYPDYPSDIQAWIASQLELDRAMEKLVELLEEAGKLDDTVIVLGGDHYPYFLSDDATNKNFFIKNLNRDLTIGINYSNVIIWNNQVKHEKITKVFSSQDILPTVYNLFGIKYDSRILTGKDVFAPGDGIAIFGNRSWVTDKGTYYASNSKFTLAEGVTLEDEQEYIKEIKNLVNDRINLGNNLIRKGYYVTAWKYLK